MSVQSTQPCIPELLVRLEPGRYAPEAMKLDAAGALLSVPTLGDEACLTKHLEMLGDRRQAEVEGSGDIVYRCLTPSESTQNRSARRMCEGRELQAQGITGLHGLSGCRDRR